MYNSPRLFLLNWGWLLNWILTGLAAVVLILVLCCAYFYSANIQKQQTIDDRQAFLQQLGLLESVNNEITQGLVNLVAETNDKDLAALLDAQGIVLRPNNPGPRPAAP
jgi:hypothetical protein